MKGNEANTTKQPNLQPDLLAGTLSGGIIAPHGQLSFL
jgi:hypothetical protein